MKKKKQNKQNKFIRDKGVGERKQKIAPVSLKNHLDRIYNSVDLRTTCNHNLTCCETGCPQMYFSEFSSLIQHIWDTTSRSEKIDLICTSIEYLFRNEFEKWGMESLIKKCPLLDEKKGVCKYYDYRCVNCRLYGLWPKKDYEERVDKFEKAYKGLLKRKELPLNTQCPYVKRVNETDELTIEVINGLFEQLDKLDKRVGNFSGLQMSQKENYRTFHDWLLFKVFGEEWLVNLTTFMLAANKDVLVEQVEALKEAVKQKFSKDMPTMD